MQRKLKLHFFVINDEDTVLLQKSIDIVNGIKARQKRKIGLEKFIRKAESIETKIRLKRLPIIKNLTK